MGQAIKHLQEALINTLSDKVNLVNIVTGATYAHVIAFIDFTSVTAKDLAHWTQTLIGIGAGLFLLGYNAIRFFREWSKNNMEDES